MESKKFLSPNGRKKMLFEIFLVVAAVAATTITVMHKLQKSYERDLLKRHREELESIIRPKDVL